MKYVDGYVLPRSAKKPRRLSPHGAGSRQGLAKIWRARVSRMRGGRSQNGEDKFFPEYGETQARRDGDVLMDRFRSRADRDRVNAKVMKDPRLAKMMDMKAMPFDSKRMAYGGFKVLVDV
jgi:uncharacterized protein YbaA (DUF1428 family)